MREKWDSADFAIVVLLAPTILISAIAYVGGAISEAREHYKPPAFEATIQAAQGKWDLGSKVHRWSEGANYMHIAAPHSAVVILLPDGRRVVIGREEIERRAVK